MSVRCQCGKPSNGQVGMVKFCFDCIGRLMGFDRSDPRLRDEIHIQLRENGAPTGKWALWQPWASMRKEHRQ